MRAFLSISHVVSISQLIKYVPLFCFGTLCIDKSVDVNLVPCLPPSCLKVFFPPSHNSRERYILHLIPGFGSSHCDSVGVFKLTLCGDLILMLQILYFMPSDLELRFCLGSVISAGGITQALFQENTVLCF